MSVSLAVVCVIAAYLLGATPFALLFARLFRLPDPRSYGSGNTGATNIARSGNKTAAILTLFADAGKGAMIIPLAPDAAVAAAAGAAAVAGHVFSVFLRFRGGRGVATALGVFLAWEWRLGLIVLAVWGGVFALLRYSSAASICAVSVATLLFFVYAPTPYAAAAAVINIIVVFRHRQNIARLVAGKESGFKKP